MKDKKEAMILLTAIILLIIGFVMFILWYYTAGMIAPGSSYPDVAPFYFILLSLIFIFSGLILLVWNAKLKLRWLKILAIAIILCFFPISCYSIYNEYYVRYTLPSFEFQPDVSNKTITLIEFNPGGFANQLNWDDIVVTMGNATLPTGLISEGDVITNCSGIIKMYIRLPCFTGHTFLYSYGFD